MSDQNQNERLARLEAKLEFLKELLTEIRNDVKNNPSKTDYDNLDNRLRKVENTMAKAAVVSGILGIIGGSLIKYLLG